MSTARILKDHALNSSESLVLVAVSSNDTVQEYIAIAKHGDGLSFRCAERVTEVDKNLVWMKRTMFNGRSADQLINENRAAVIDSRKITLDKSKSPTA